MRFVVTTITCFFMFLCVTNLTGLLSSSVYQQDSYYETCDNVYEDVENINKFILGQNSRKRKAGLKSKNVFLIQCFILS